MRTYMDIHEGFVGVTQAEFEVAHKADLMLQDEEGVNYERAWLDQEFTLFWNNRGV